MKARSLLIAAPSVALLVGSVVAAGAVKLDGSKCAVKGNKDATKVSTYYKCAKVHFCCGGCLKAFKADTEKFAASANLQLVATKQAKQKKCGFTGRKLNPETAIEINGVKVCFCCNNCKKKAVDADDQVKVVFNDKSFAKGFVVNKAKK